MYYCSMSKQTESLSSFLKEKGYSATKPRLDVFKTLSGHEPLSMAEIINKASKVDRASVYRTIGLFEELKIVRRLNLGWKYKIELSDKFSHHHHHLTCSKCGKIIPITEDIKLETHIRMLAAREHFKPEDHELEIHGLCRTCR